MKFFMRSSEAFFKEFQNFDILKFAQKVKTQNQSPRKTLIDFSLRTFKNLFDRVFDETSQSCSRTSRNKNKFQDLQKRKNKLRLHNFFTKSRHRLCNEINRKFHQCHKNFHQGYENFQTSKKKFFGLSS